MASGSVIIRATSKGHIGSEFAAAVAGSGQFNHCMIIDGRRHYEAVPWYGVRVVPERVAMRGVARYQDRIATVPNIEAMRDYLESQLGSGYDYPGAIGLPLNRASEWQDPKRLWCWEYAITACGAGGLWLIEQAKISSGTPNHVLRSNLPSTEIFHITASP